MAVLSILKQKNGRPRVQVNWEKANENPAERLKLARDMLSMGADTALDIQQRLDALHQAVLLDPFQLSYRLKLAELETDADLFEQAAETYKECQEYWPENTEVSMSLCEVYLESGNAGRARELLKAIEQPEKNEFFYRKAFGLIECDLREGKWQEAMDGLQKIKWEESKANQADAVAAFLDKCIKIALENTDHDLLNKVLALADEKVPDKVHSKSPSLMKLRALLEKLVKFDPSQEADLPKTDDFEKLLFTYKLSQYMPLQAGSVEDDLISLKAWQKRLKSAGNKPGALREAYMHLLDNWANQAYRQNELRLADLLWSESERLSPWQPEIAQNLAILHTRMKDEDGYNWYWDKVSKVWVYYSETMPEADGYKQNLILKHRAFIEGAQAKCTTLQDWRQLIELGTVWVREAICYFALAQIEYRNPYHRLGLQKSDFAGDEERAVAIESAYSVMSCWLEQVAAWEGLGRNSSLYKWRIQRLDEAKEALISKSPAAIQYYENEQKTFTAMRELMTGQYLYLFFRIVSVVAEKVKFDDTKAMESYIALIRPFLTFPHEILKPGVLKAVEQLKPETDLRVLAQNHSAVPWVSAAQAHMEEGQTHKAEPILNKMLEVIPDFVPGMFLLARCYEEQEKYDRAYEVLDRARKLVRPGDEYGEHIKKFSQQMDMARVSNRLKKVQDLIQKGDAAGALTECKAALKAYPGHPYVLFVMAQAHLACADVVSAKDALKRAAKSVKGNEELQEAINKNLEQIDKQGAEIILSRAVEEMNSQHWKEAIAYLENGKGLKPPDARIPFYEAICYSRLGKIQQAEEYAQAALEQARGNKELKDQIKAFIPQISQAAIAEELMKARKQLETEKWRSAIEYLDQAEKIAPKELTMLYYQAICHFRLNELDKAQSYTKRALAECRRDNSAANQQIIDQLNELDKAIPQARRRAEINSIAEDINRGYFNAALNKLNELLRSTPDNDELYYLRAVCRFRDIMSDINSGSVTPSSILFNEVVQDIARVNRGYDRTLKEQANALMKNVAAVISQLRDAGYY